MHFVNDKHANSKCWSGKEMQTRHSTVYVFQSHFFLLTLNLIFFLFTSLYHVLFSSSFRSWNQWHSNQRGSRLLKSFLGSCLIRLKSILGWCVVPYSSIIYQPEWQFIRSTPFTTQSKFKQCQFYHRRTTKDLYGVI